MIGVLHESIHFLKNKMSVSFPSSSTPQDLPAWSAGHSSTIGFGLLKVTRSALDFKYFTAHPEAEGGAELLDSFTMTK